MGERTSIGRFLVGLVLAWILPGLGHFYYGRQAKALFFFALLSFVFLLGLWLGDFRDVNVDKFPLYLMAQIWMGGPVLLSLLLTSDLTITQDIAQFDAGLLFTTVAGLLNIVVMVDLYEIHRKIDGGLEDVGSDGKKGKAAS